jgi:hypothetical protein
MNQATLLILLVVTAWRIAARPFVVRMLEPKKWTPTPRGVVTMFTIWFLELAVAIALCFAWPEWAWLSILIILVGQEARYWVVFVHTPKSGDVKL